MLICREPTIVRVTPFWIWHWVPPPLHFTNALQIVIVWLMATPLP